MFEGATVLAVNRQGDSSSITLALALSSDERDELARSLGSSDGFILQRPTPTPTIVSTPAATIPPAGNQFPVASH